MKHFIVINDWANDYENGASILGVTHSMEEAKEIFKQNYMDEKNYAEEHNFTIYEDSDVDFDAGEDGYYVSNHTHLFIKMV